MPLAVLTQKLGELREWVLAIEGMSKAFLDMLQDHEHRIKSLEDKTFMMPESDDR